MQQDNYNSVTILVQSCDKYDDIWPVFFEVFKQQWPDCPYQIVLNTEQKTYQHPGLNIKCLQLYKGYTEETLQHISWSERYIETLKHIQTKYVLVILEDFFIREKVDTAAFVHLVNKVDKINKFAAVYFNFLNTPVFYKKKYDLFYIHNDTWTRVNSVSGLWRTDELRKTLIPGESPWEYEQMATARYKKKRVKFYTVNHETSPIKMDFHEQIMQGKWTEDCVALLQRMGICVDFSVRGVVKMERSLRQTFSEMTLKNKIIALSERNLSAYNALLTLRKMYRWLNGKGGRKNQ